MQNLSHDDLLECQQLSTLLTQTVLNVGRLISNPIPAAYCDLEGVSSNVTHNRMDWSTFCLGVQSSAGGRICLDGGPSH